METLKSKKDFFWIGCLLLLIVIGTLTGCASTMMSVEHSDSSSMSMTYKKFNGTKDRSIKLDAGSSIAVDVETNDGSIEISIVDGDGNSCYHADEIPTSSFTVDIAKTDTYKITITADSHSGSYSFDWSGETDTE